VAPIRLGGLAGSVRPKTGVLAFTSSIMGSVSLNTGGHELYRASKAALNSLSRGLWSEVKRRGITLLTLHPGWVRTDMGGPGASLSVKESTRGIVDMLDARAGTGRHGFVDYRGRTVAW
jgi:NAD(P)-dependent dehydrogenase (short-subunit alcohol dehydrogenase family)